MTAPFVTRAFSRLRHESRRAARALVVTCGLGDRLDVVLDRRRALGRMAPGGWHDRLLALLETGVVVRTDAAWASPSTASIPLVMCLWNRPERIHEIVDMLQGLDHPVRLLLWNNAEDQRETYAWVESHVPRGSLESVDIVHSPENIGGLARFVAVRFLRNSGYDGPVVMLDDDQDVAASFVDDLLADYRPDRIAAWWAFDFGPSYWDRVQIDVGSRADHGGTGGTVMDASLVDDDSFFLSLPERYAFLEDQWMSHYAHSLGWTIVKTKTEIGFVLEHKNQYHGLHDRKDEFHRHLMDGSISSGARIGSSATGRRRARLRRASPARRG